MAPDESMNVELRIQEEYKDEVHHLQGLPREHRIKIATDANMTVDLTRNVAETLYQEGTEMQRSLENSIVEYRNRSELANFSHHTLIWR